MKRAFPASPLRKNRVCWRLQIHESASGFLVVQPKAYGTAGASASRVSHLAAQIKTLPAAMTFMARRLVGGERQGGSADGARCADRVGQTEFPARWDNCAGNQGSVCLLLG